MNAAEALRSIRYDLMEYIQKKVRVKKHIVHETLGRFRTQAKGHINGFLVKADNDEVYFLYFQRCDRNQRSPFNRGFWVLSFRILGDRELMALYREERKMPVNNMTLKKVVDFHGHLCPELVIGCKACEYARRLLSVNGNLEGEISVIAENCTSALDAIQVLLGVTLGSQRLKVFDFGRHNYTFLLKNGQNGLRLSLKEQHYGDENEYRTLEQKIMKDQVSLDEVVQFQQLLDSRVKRLLSSLPEDLFNVRRERTRESLKKRLYLNRFGSEKDIN
ncbi:MAG: formylmethanofuran dehydrogenase subunit E family protein [Deltaproteobacteria bacterium]|nr:formylmethanofuran dehydrogenase subunit E family protein [Deltaproteobacteria bacterium]